MACENKLYVNSHTVVTFTIVSGFSVSDIVSMTVNLTLISNSISKSLGSGLTINDPNIVMEIESSDITQHGIYKIHVEITDTNGDLKRVTPCPETIEFYR